MSDKYNILFTPFNIGKQQIKNRFIMGPMGCNQMYDSYGALNNDGIAYYTERAKGGFGAVFLGRQAGRQLSAYISRKPAVCTGQIQENGQYAGGALRRIRHESVRRSGYGRWP